MPLAFIKLGTWNLDIKVKEKVNYDFGSYKKWGLNKFDL